MAFESQSKAGNYKKVENSVSGYHCLQVSFNLWPNIAQKCQNGFALRQPEVVSFDLENVQYISRPTSIYFNTVQDCPDLVQDLTSHRGESKISGLINSMAKVAQMRHLNEDEDQCHLEEPIEELHEDEPIKDVSVFAKKRAK